jgi:hypothetical protein
MSDVGSVLLRQHIEKHWLTWAAVNHFLPAPALRELFVIIVDQISAQALTFDQLFEDGGVAGPIGLESWLIRARSVTNPLATYLQRRLQYLLWRNDADAYPPESGEPRIDQSYSPTDLENAVMIGCADFGANSRKLNISGPAIESSLTTLTLLIRNGSERFAMVETDGYAQEVRGHLADVDATIACAIAKHLGDLCADSDLWHEAKLLYDLAGERLSEATEVVWRPYESGMRDIIFQSIAAATRSLAGPKPALEQLHGALELASLSTNPVLVLNASYDAIAAQFAAGIIHGDERRGLLLEPGFYQGSHDLDLVSHYVNTNNFPEAQRHCWAVLRRQIALGLASETRTTKSVFGRTILAALERSNDHEDWLNFSMAIRLLLESGDTTLDKYDWPQTLVDSYVNAEIVSKVVEIVKRYDGTRIERERVAIEMFRGWLVHISNDKHEIADCMIRFLAHCARDQPVAFMSTQNVGGRSLEILRDVGRKRPELRVSNAVAVEDAIVSRLESTDFWKGRSAALELAEQFLDAFSADQVRNVVERTLSVLAAMDPATQMWPIVRPALQVLASRPSAHICKADPLLGRRVLDTILRFGTQDTQSSGLLFLLRDFDVVLLRDPNIVATLQPTVKALRKRIESVNSSATAGEIQALLLSPTISGLEGVKDAVNALKRVVRSSEASRPSIALSYGYAPLQMLVGRQQAFADELPLPRTEIDEIWNDIYEDLLKLWDQIRVKPALLAPFSIPPVDRPDSVLVHNWTFASVRFAECIGKRNAMVQAVQHAAEQPSIRDAIKVALVTGATLDRDVAIEAKEIGGETAQVFYAGLGRRLILLGALDRTAAIELCRILFQQCVRFGPRGLDAAVLVYANQLDLAGRLDAESTSDYLKRVDENRELRLSLLPLLAALKIHLT